MALPAFLYSGVSYDTPTASTTTLNLLTSPGGVPIPYLERSHIEVLSTIDDGETLNTLSRPAEWDFNAEGTVVELATPADGATSYVIRRVTPLASAYVTFSSGRLSPEQLNQAALFSLYVLQEYLDESGAGTAINLVALTGRVTANEVDIAAVQSDFADYVLLADAAAAVIQAAFAAIEADNWVTNARMANNSVGTAELINASVTANKLANNSVDTAAIQTNAVTAAKIATNAVTAAKIATNAVTAGKIAANAVGSGELANNAVDAAAIANGAVTASKLAAGAVNDAAIGNNVLSPIVSSLNGGQLAGLRNLLINASQNINQRGYVSGAATSSAHQYTIDRWRVVASGQSLSWTTSIGITTYTAPSSGVEQIIEFIPISGSYTLSWVGTATGRVNGGLVASGGNISLTGGTSATIRFSGGTFSRPQFELGTQATAFEFRPTALELTLCKRYYERIAFGGSGWAPGAGQYRGGFTNYVEKRANPTSSAASMDYVNCSGVTLQNTNLPATGLITFITTPASGAFYYDGTMILDAEL